MRKLQEPRPAAGLPAARVVFKVFAVLLLFSPAVFCPASDFMAEEGEVIGRSVEGRPIEAYRFGRGGPLLLIYGGIHGAYEWNTVDLARRLLRYFSEDPDALPPAVRLIIIPVVNPDGLARISGGRPFEEVDFNSIPIQRRQEGRLNANGVDLNRNWDNNWEPVSYWRSQEVDAGSAPFSEPETRALRDFVRRIEPDLIISYHSAANGIYYAGKREGWKPAKRFAEGYSKASGYPIPESSLVGYRITGASTGYFRSLGIPAMVVELAGRRGPEFEKNLRGIEEVLKLLAEGRKE